MQKYNYKALSPSGKVIKGKLIANNPDELKTQVSKNGLFLVSFAEDAKGEKISKRLDFKNLITLCNQLGSMLKAGLSIANALEMLYSRVDNPSAKKALGQMYETVQKGNSLSDAIREMGNTFPPIMLSMVRAGELSGELDMTMKKLGNHFESEQKLNNQVKSAMSYPLVLLVLSIAVVIVMVVFVLPTMAANFGDLPPLTLMLLKLADWFKSATNVILLGSFILIMLIIIPILKNVPSIKYNLDRLKLKIPKLGKLIRMVYTARFSRGLATLYDNGIELITSMEMCKDLVNNTYIADRMSEAIERIKKGETISSAMGSINVFDPLLISMIFVGEESGVLGEVLNQTADYFDEESNFSIKKIVGLINPVMIVFMALVVGVIMMAIMGPIVNMYNMDLG